MFVIKFEMMCTVVRMRCGLGIGCQTADGAEQSVGYTFDSTRHNVPRKQRHFSGTKEIAKTPVPAKLRQSIPNGKNSNFKEGIRI